MNKIVILPAQFENITIFSYIFIICNYFNKKNYTFIIQMPTHNIYVAYNKPALPPTNITIFTRSSIKYMLKL